MKYRAELGLETLTPLFMRGANQSKSEIRAASIKGIMRWWFRALAGNFFGNDFKELMTAEGNVFGITGSTLSKKSSVIIRVSPVSPNSQPKSIFFRHRRFDRDSWVWDLQYLFFSIKILAQKGEIKSFYPPNSNFKVEILSYDECAFKTALASLWVSVTLGGFGFRGRRGGGNFILKKNNSLDTIGLYSHIKSYEDIKKGIDNAIKIFENCLGVKKQRGPFSYSVLSASSSMVGVTKEIFRSPKDALIYFQEEYRKFRRKEEYKEKRVVFGLPIVRGDLGRVSNVAKKSRRASPIIVSVNPIYNNYALTLTLFKTKPFHPDLKVVDWRIPMYFNRNISERIIYGSKGVFE